MEKCWRVAVHVHRTPAVWIPWKTTAALGSIDGVKGDLSDRSGKQASVPDPSRWRARPGRPAQPARRDREIDPPTHQGTGQTKWQLWRRSFLATRISCGSEDGSRRAARGDHEQLAIERAPGRCPTVPRERERQGRRFRRPGVCPRAVALRRGRPRAGVNTDPCRASGRWIRSPSLCPARAHVRVRTLYPAARGPCVDDRRRAHRAARRWQPQAGGASQPGRTGTAGTIEWWTLLPGLLAVVSRLAWSPLHAMPAGPPQ